MGDIILKIQCKEKKSYFHLLFIIIKRPGENNINGEGREHRGFNIEDLV